MQQSIFDPVLKTRIISLLGILGILLFVQFYVAYGEPMASKTPENIHIGWQSDDTAHTITVSWKTAENALSRVYFDTDPHGGNVIDYTDSETGSTHSNTGIPNAYHHDVELTGLEPDTVYYFICGETDNWSEEMSFKTGPASASSTRFIATGDCYTDLSKRDLLSARFAARSPSFVIASGDFVNYWNNHPLWDSLLNGIDNLWVTSEGYSIPIIPGIGNHDVMVSGSYDYTSWYERFALLGNEEWYSLDWGPNIHIIVLNSEKSNYASQTEWLEADLAAHEDVLWKIVMFHRNVIPGNTHSADLGALSNWVPLFNEYHVDIVFQGHCHYYTRSKPLVDAITPVESYDEGTMYVITAGWGSPLYNPFDDVWVASFIKSYHYTVVDVFLDGSLCLTAYDDEEALIDEVWLYKDVNSPTISIPSPFDDATYVPVTISSLVFSISDPDGDHMDVEVTTTPDIGVSTVSDVGNGWISVSISGLEYSTTYTWTVTADDLITTPTVETYSFTTQALGATQATLEMTSLDPYLTSPSGTYRWLDVADQQYSSDYRNSYNYLQGTADVTHSIVDNKLHGTMTGSNLKPNFVYQVKLVGTPGTPSNELVGYAGRWWQEEWDGTQWTGGQNLNNKGDGSSPNPNDLVYESRKTIVDATSPTGLKYRYTGYLVLDYFTTDENGEASLMFETGSSHHVLWKTTQRTPTSDDGEVKTAVFDPDSGDLAYDMDYPSNMVSIFGEWERLPMGKVPLDTGTYYCQIVLTEESFHGSGGTYAGNWAGAMGANINFQINEEAHTPTITNPTLPNGAIDVPVSTSSLSFSISDPDGDPMDYTVTTDPPIGSGGGAGVGDGTYSVDVSELLHDTSYTWTIDATDGVNLVQAVYTFTTEEPHPSKLSLVVRGGDDKIYYNVWDDDGSAWTGWVKLPGSTPGRPATATIGTDLHMVVRGSDGGIYHGVVDLDTDSFSGWTKFPGGTPSAPSLAATDTGLILTVRGNDNNIYYSLYDGSWISWKKLPGSTPDAVGSTVIGDTYHVMARGSDSKMYHGTMTVSTEVFHGWTLMTGTTPSQPVLCDDESSLYLVVRGSNDGIYWSEWDGSWSVWTKVPGSTAQSPGAAIHGGDLWVCVTGMTTGFYYGSVDLDTSAWSGWGYLAGSSPSPPTLIG